MAVSIPLFPTIIVAFIRYSGHITALYRQALAWTLRVLLRRKVCVRSTHAYVFSSCTHGKADSVLETFDLYANTHPSLCISPQMCEYASEFINEEHYEKRTCNIYMCMYVLMQDGYQPSVWMGKACSLLLISTSAPLLCLSCSARSGSDAGSSVFGVGAGDALWLQFSPPAASAAPSWQTHHSGGGPCDSRIRGRNPSSSWFQTLSGA